jgi:MFS family permease
MNHPNSTKITILVVLGTILEYYDFLLFAHLGFIITPLFFPDHSATQTHLLSLALFGLSFIVRPIGGLVFGIIADSKGRKEALIKSVKWAIIPAIGLTFLPSYEIIGILGTIVFVILRLLQGVALGGEYPAAGIYLMELNDKNKGFISSILVAAGSIGSLIGLIIAIICAQECAPSWLWRVAFAIGAIGTIFSYYMRKYLIESITINADQRKEKLIINNLLFRRILVIILGILISTLVWLPMVYSNFYVTKILNLSKNIGLYASFVAAISYIIIAPIMGKLYDTISRNQYMIFSSVMILPLILISFNLLLKGNITLAQIGLCFVAATFAAPQHTIISSLFPTYYRGRNIGFLFMLGLSFGGLFPSLAGFIVDATKIDIAPAIITCVIALITCLCFYKFYKYDKESI